VAPKTNATNHDTSNFTSCENWNVQIKLVFSLARICYHTSNSQPKLNSDPCMEYRVIFLGLYLLFFNVILTPTSFFHMCEMKVWGRGGGGGGVSLQYLGME
jgi:hypothetical protein